MLNQSAKTNTDLKQQQVGVGFTDPPKKKKLKLEQVEYAGSAKTQQS
jgi:hypothetical protein